MIRDRLKNRMRKMAIKAFGMEFDTEDRDPNAGGRANPDDFDPSVIPKIVDGAGDTPGPNHKEDIGRTWVAAQARGGCSAVLCGHPYTDGDGRRRLAWSPSIPRAEHQGSPGYPSRERCARDRLRPDRRAGLHRVGRMASRAGLGSRSTTSGRLRRVDRAWRGHRDTAAHTPAKVPSATPTWPAATRDSSSTGRRMAPHGCGLPPGRSPSSAIETGECREQIDRARPYSSTIRM